MGEEVKDLLKKIQPDYIFHCAGNSSIKNSIKNPLNDFQNNIRLVGEKVNDPFEKPLHDMYSKEKCLAPIGSLSYHINRHVPATTENWTNLWQKNFQKL